MKNIGIASAAILTTFLLALIPFWTSGQSVSPLVVNDARNSMRIRLIDDDSDGVFDREVILDIGQNEPFERRQIIDLGQDGEFTRDPVIDIGQGDNEFVRRSILNIGDRTTRSSSSRSSQSSSSRSNSSGSGYYDATCAQQVTGQREDRIIDAWNSYANQIRTALQQRRGDLLEAVALSTQSERREASQDIWQYFRDARSDIRRSYNDSIDEIWDDYDNDIRECTNQRIDRARQSADRA